jgi:hypothetical protein
VDERRRGDPPLPAELEAALREWTAFAGTTRAGDPEEQELVRRRGRQLASRAADVLGRPVEFVDPVTGEVERVQVSASPRPRPRVQHRADAVAQPTPWATGLVVAAFFAVLAAVADIALSQALAEAFGLLWVPANLVAGAGLAPSLWLLRDVPFWRWTAFGTAVGLVVAWLALLVGQLA